jgi:hypothetical protein
MKRQMTVEEVMAWVESAPTAKEQAERAESGNAGYFPDIEDPTLAPNGKKKVIVELVGQDGNAFAILGRCSKAMRRAGWGTTEIRVFQDKATAGDYNHLLATVMEYVDEPDVEEDEEEDDWNPYADNEEEEFR